MDNIKDVFISTINDFKIYNIDLTNIIMDINILLKNNPKKIAGKKINKINDLINIFIQKQSDPGRCLKRLYIEFNNVLDLENNEIIK